MSDQALHKFCENLAHSLLASSGLNLISELELLEGVSCSTKTKSMGLECLYF